jgi:hypothetical protein
MFPSQPHQLKRAGIIRLIGKKHYFVNFCLALTACPELLSEQDEIPGDDEPPAGQEPPPDSTSQPE